jgi:hypothetical protein
MARYLVCQSLVHFALTRPSEAGSPEAILLPAKGQAQARLGLFIGREIVQAHGGQVDVVSEVGEMVFTMILPSRTDGTEPTG